ncbi:unnamed protein product [Macrosiphum euphorbiae]|uniref:Uncharacterized protein n=1 Tax=Macrosiphum euphorbiae TaxID=13131 RepID=A0AAV0WRY9_9HEMI|nr:unnamed protein product [Macrosiphum euphorbiae]
MAQINNNLRPTSNHRINYRHLNSIQHACQQYTLGLISMWQFLQRMSHATTTYEQQQRNWAMHVDNEPPIVVQPAAPIPGAAYLVPVVALVPVGADLFPVIAPVPVAADSAHIVVPVAADSAEVVAPVPVANLLPVIAPTDAAEILQLLEPVGHPYHLKVVNITKKNHN